VFKYTFEGATRRIVADTGAKQTVRVGSLHIHTRILTARQELLSLI
jgi:hypothetical protein